MKTAILALLGVIIGKVLADEAKELMIWLPARLIRLASKQFLPESQAGIEEEWLAHCNDLPGNLAKLLHALGCVLAAFKLTHALTKIGLTVLFIPAVELVTPYAIGASILGRRLGLLDFRPETARARRIKKGAAGLVVLGLNRLELIPSDYLPGVKVIHINHIVESFLFTRTGLVGQVLGLCIDRTLARYFRAWPGLESICRFEKPF